MADRPSALYRFTTAESGLIHRTVWFPGVDQHRRTGFATSIRVRERVTDDVVVPKLTDREAAAH